MCVQYIITLLNFLHFNPDRYLQRYDHITYFCEMINEKREGSPGVYQSVIETCQSITIRVEMSYRITAWKMIV